MIVYLYDNKCHKEVRATQKAVVDYCNEFKKVKLEKHFFYFQSESEKTEFTQVTGFEFGIQMFGKRIPMGITGVCLNHKKGPKNVSNSK